MPQKHASYDRAPLRKPGSLEVRALRSASHRDRFWWMLRNRDGQLIETSSTTYATEAEASCAAERAARGIRGAN